MAVEWNRLSPPRQMQMKCNSIRPSEWRVIISVMALVFALIVLSPEAYAPTVRFGYRMF